MLTEFIITLQALVIILAIFIAPPIAIGVIIIKAINNKKAKKKNNQKTQPSEPTWEYNKETGRWEPTDKSRILAEQEKEEPQTGEYHMKWESTRPKKDSVKPKEAVINSSNVPPLDSLWNAVRNDKPPTNGQYHGKGIRQEVIGKRTDFKQAYKQPEPEKEKQTATPQEKEHKQEYSHVYQSRYLFTKNELYHYKKLKAIADEKGYIICPKVRLFDIVEPRHNLKKYKTYKNKVQSKHVDFVICDKGMHIKAILELDDSSHDQQDRKERDEFVDAVLKSVGYKVIHTRYITDDTLDAI